MKNECDYLALSLSQESKAKTNIATHDAESRHGNAHFIRGFLFFHAMNAVLGIAAFFTVAFGLFFSVAFLPLCCLGIAVLKVVCVTVDALAWLDVELANSIGLQQLQPCEPYSLAEEKTGCMDASQLSREQMTHIAFFLMVKPFVSVLSVVELALTIVLPVQLLTGAHATVVDCIVDERITQLQLVSVLVFLGFWLLGVAGIYLVARASWHLTRRFCATSDSHPNLSVV